MKRIRKILLMLSVLSMLMGLCSACGSGRSADGKTHLTFQIWDVAQREGMQAVCDAYTEQHPDVVIEVQVTSWSEYWTKLEATAISNQMPDIFWMHTNEILKYADYGKIADLTDLYDEEDPDFYAEHYSEVSLSNIQGSNGKYGYMAYGDDQLGYWNFVYQNGGCILKEDNITGGFDEQATIDAMAYYINLQKNDWCPDQNYFAETSPGTAFFSEQGAMFFEGDWNVLNEMKNYPNMEGKWDIAVLPKCPNPASGDGRATISNGLCYATSATGKNLEVVKDVLRFFGSEEGQRIQGESGAAIPAYIGLEDTWVGVFDQFDYRLNVEKFVDMFDYSIQSVNNKYRPTWKTQVTDNLLKIYSGDLSIEEGLANMQEAVRTAAEDD